jgi:hypothetical protein
MEDQLNAFFNNPFHECILFPWRTKPNFSGTTIVKKRPLSVVTEGSARLFHRYVSYHEPMAMFQKQIIA